MNEEQNFIIRRTVARKRKIWIEEIATQDEMGDLPLHAMLTTKHIYQGMQHDRIC